MARTIVDIDENIVRKARQQTGLKDGNRIFVETSVNLMRDSASMSIGVVFHALDTPCFIDELMSRADALMYEQKKRKREQRSG